MIGTPTSCCVNSQHSHRRWRQLNVVVKTEIAHVAVVWKTCNHICRALRHIRRLLPLDVARTLTSSIVGARLDYCNSVLYGAPTSSIRSPKESSLKSQLWRIRYALLLVQRICTRCCRTTSVDPRWYCGRHLGRFYTYHDLELSTAVAVDSDCCSVAAVLHQLHGTVCLLTLLTLHH